MEDPAKRLQRFQDGPPDEIILTLLNSMDNFYKRDIDIAAEKELWLLVILGIHSFALTIAEGFFGKTGLEGFRLFLEKFMDGKAEGFDFSKIADKIHTYRNVIAHQWLSVSGYNFGENLSLQKGWEEKDDVIWFNPKMYYEAFDKSFSGGGRIWDYRKILNAEEQLKTKERLIKKYLGR